MSLHGFLSLVEKADFFVTLNVVFVWPCGVVHFVKGKSEECDDLWQVLTLNVEEKLKPVVEFFRSMGLNKERDIEMLLVRNAQILCCSIEKNLRPKFLFFKGLGLTENSIADMIVLFPSMLGQSIEGSLAPKFNYLIHEMNRPIEELVEFPQVSNISLNHRFHSKCSFFLYCCIHINTLRNSSDSAINR